MARHEAVVELRWKTIGASEKTNKLRASDRANCFPA
jgi:hypothetical protein